MCNPTAVVIAGMVMSAAGSAISSRQAAANVRRGANAVNSVTQKEFDRQRAFQEEAGGTFDKSVNRFQNGNAQQELGDARSERVAKAENAVDSTKAISAPTSRSAPAVVGQTQKRASDTARAFAKNVGGAQADLSGYGDFIFDNKIATNRFGQPLFDTAQNARGSARLLPLERKAAFTNSQKAPGMIGPLFKVVGQGLSMYGGAGGSFGAGGAGGSFMDAGTTAIPARYA